MTPRSLSDLGFSIQPAPGAQEILAERENDLERAVRGLVSLRRGENFSHGERVRVFDLPYTDRGVQDSLPAIRDWANDLVASERARRTILFGIGGSSQGARMLLSALATDPMRRVEIVDTIDPDWLLGFWRGVDLARTHFVFVSKSGSTAEIVALYADLLARLAQEGLEPARHVTVVTGLNGYLASEASRLGLVAFPVPEGVGGRWSVLSPVGLVPAAIAGIDIEILLEGARETDLALSSASARANEAARLALVVHEYARRGRRILCPFVYSERLREIGGWLVQLVMESLGKGRTRSGGTSEAGITVLAARGTADQHSILQDLVQGHPDKFVLVVAARPTARLPLPGRLPGLGAPAALAGGSLELLFDACRSGTRESLIASGCPVMEIQTPPVSGRTLGGLVVFFEWTVALLAELYDVDAFDQPGVEDAKRRTLERLARGPNCSF